MPSYGTVACVSNNIFRGGASGCGLCICVCHNPAYRIAGNIGGH